MRLAATPSIECTRLEAIPQGWGAIDAAFNGRPELPLTQAWRADLEPGFRPGSARLAYREGFFCVKAELQDDDVFNPVAQFNELAFSKGDVIEVFVHAKGQPLYCEIHSTPGGAVSQLGFRAAHPKESPFFISTPTSRALSRKTSSGWSVYLEIPFELPGVTPLPGAEWAIAICRYDHTRGQPNPILSSTAALTERNFHQMEKWNSVVFK